ncbi:MAG: dipicolinate synthase subunit DpsA [Bacillota bacterium]|nr:dipicolinate synthase subunit DpsA [Bacillota bacterium]
MDVILLGLNILIIGGDRREVEVYYHLKKNGANVSLYGFEKYPHSGDITVTDNLIESIRISDVIITPLTGIEANGEVYTPFGKGKVCINQPDILKAIKPKTLFIAGYVWPSLKEILIQKNIIVKETREMDEISVPNAIPTAEGAVYTAMANTEITIHNSNCLVLGFGRCGQILARTLKALGAEVTVAVRRKEVLPWIEACKMKPLLLENFTEEIKKADIIFNTIPSLVLNAEILYRINKATLIIDIASHPGGVDFAAAERLNLKAILLLGLPGRVAPQTAAKILCKVYPDIIVSSLKRGEKF